MSAKRWMGRTLMVLTAIPLFATSVASAGDGEFVWARAASGTGHAVGDGVAADAEGNVYVSGHFSGTVDFDPGPDVLNYSAAQSSGFLLKLDAAGNLLWVRTVSGTNLTAMYGVAVDTAGNAYTTGIFYGTADLDPGPGTLNFTSAGSQDFFAQKFDTNGNLLWVRVTGGTENERGHRIAVDALGNAYVTGFFYGTVDFDPGPSTWNRTSAGAIDVFVQKLDSEGNLAWAQTVGGTGYDSGRGIAVDANGNTFTTGFFEGTADFDPGLGMLNLSTVGSRDAFLLKLDADGLLVWAHALGGTGHDGGSSVAADTGGNVIVLGIYADTVDFDPGQGTFNLASSGASDVFIQKLDADGGFLWVRGAGGTGGEYGDDIAIDAANNVYAAGRFRGIANFGPDVGSLNLDNAGSQDIFALKLNARGRGIWVGGVGGSASNYVHGITVDGMGNSSATGSFRGTVDFDPGVGIFNLSNTPTGDDMFVQKLSGSNDVVAPHATAITPETVGPTSANSVEFTVVFDEDVQNFDGASDLIFGHNGTASTGVTITGSGDTYFVTVTGIGGNGTFTLAVNTASDVEDLAGNSLAGSVTSAAITIYNPLPQMPVAAWPVALALLGVGIFMRPKRAT